MGIHTLYPLLAPYLPNNPIIVEAGAHIGRDTKKMAKKWPQGHIHAFEPVPQLFEQLQKNTSGLSNVTCYPYALSDISAQQIIYVSSGRSTATSSLLKPYQNLHPQTHFESQIINTITLDSWAQRYKIKQVDFFWFDMQGNELRALTGGQQLIKTTQAIFTEISLEARYENNPLYAELKKWLERHNFIEIYQKLIQPTWGNALFISNSF